MMKRRGTLITILSFMLLLVACSSTSKVNMNETSDAEKKVMEQEDEDPSAFMEKNDTITPAIEEDKSTIEESDATDSETQTKQNKSITIKRLDFPWEVTKDWGEGLLGFQNPETELWGFCDLAGNVVLEAQYNSINGFNDGYAEVRKPGSNQYYYIDKTGHIDENYTIHETEENYEYSDAIDTHFENFNDYYCLIFDRTEKYGLYNNCYPEDLDQSSIKNKNFETVVEGGDLLKLFPDLTGIGLTDDYIAVYKVLDIGDSNYDITSSLIDYDLNIIIEPGRYDYLLPLDKDHIIVANYDEQYGLINGKGEVLVELSDKKIKLMPTEADPDKFVLREGWFLFHTNNSRVSKREFFYTNYVVNNTGFDNYILLENEEEKNSGVASYEVCDLSQNKIVRKIPKVSISYNAPYTYLLKEFTLLSSPFACYNLEGEQFPNGDLPELMHYYRDTTYYGDTTIIILDASYCDYKYFQIIVND